MPVAKFNYPNSKTVSEEIRLNEALFPSDIEAGVAQRFQLNPRSQLSEDYFNQFYPMVALLEATPDFISPPRLFERLNRRLESVPHYPEFVVSRFEQLRLEEIQPGVTPLNLIVRARPLLGVLDHVVSNVRSLRFDVADDHGALATRCKTQELRMWVFLIRELVSGGDEAGEFARNLRVSAEAAHHLFNNPPRRAA